VGAKGSGTARGGAFERRLGTPNISLLPKPPGIDDWVRLWSAEHGPRGGAWTDVYLAAFAAASGCRLVAFDAGFHRFSAIEFLHLQAGSQ